MEELKLEFKTIAGKLYAICPIEAVQSKSLPQTVAIRIKYNLNQIAESAEEIYGCSLTDILPDESKLPKHAFVIEVPKTFDERRATNDIAYALMI